MVHVYLYMRGHSKALPRATYSMFHSEDLEVAQ